MDFDGGGDSVFLLGFLDGVHWLVVGVLFGLICGLLDFFGLHFLGFFIVPSEGEVALTTWGVVHLD